MKIIVVSQFGDVATGGAERYAREVGARLSDRHGFWVRAVSAPRNGALLKRPGVRTIAGLADLRHFFRLRRMFRQARPDWVYLHYTVPGIVDAAFLAARSLGLCCALMYHSDITGLGPKKVAGTLYFQLFGRKMVRDCALAFVNSRLYARNSPFLRGIDRSWIPAPPGLDQALVGAAGEASSQTAAPPETAAPRSPYILFVGKPGLPEKGFDVLARAWQGVVDRGVSADLVVAGGGPAKPSPSSAGRPVIRRLGHVSGRRALYRLYEGAQATVLPSVTSAESFGMVLAEALSAGCPVVGSAVGGVPEIIEDGLNGYLAAPADAASLANALEKTVRHNDRLRQYIRRHAWQLRARYDWDATTETVARAMIMNKASGGSRV